MAVVSVEGVVSRVFFDGRGAEVTEVSESKGKEFKTRWTCWFQDEHGLAVGDVVEVSGLHGDKVSDWTDKQGATRHSVERSVNRARIVGGAAQNGANGAFSAGSGTNTRSDVPTPQAGLQANEFTSWAGDSEVPF